MKLHKSFVVEPRRDKQGAFPCDKQGEAAQRTAVPPIAAVAPSLHGAALLQFGLSVIPVSPLQVTSPHERFNVDRIVENSRKTICRASRLRVKIHNHHGPLKGSIISIHIFFSKIDLLNNEIKCHGKKIGFQCVYRHLQ